MKDNTRTELAKRIAEDQARISELRGTAVDWQNQFHQLESLCIQRGLKVGYGEKGEVTLS